MKKAIALAIVLLGSISLSFSQENQTANDLISGKWQVEAMEIGGDSLDLTTNNNWFEFNTNGDYQLVLNNNKEQGTWKFVNGAKELQFDNETFENNLKIEKLNDKELLVSVTQSETAYTLILKR